MKVDIKEVEIEVSVQASMDTKTKVAVLKIQAQVEELIRFERDEKWLAQLGDVNSIHWNNKLLLIKLTIMR